MSLGDDIRDRLGDAGPGMVADLVFAVCWVTVVTGFHRAVQGPTWAYYLLLGSGIPAYFVFVASLSVARTSRGEQTDE